MRCSTTSPIPGQPCADRSRQPCWRRCDRSSERRRNVDEKRSCEQTHRVSSRPPHGRRHPSEDLQLPEQPDHDRRQPEAQKRRQEAHAQRRRHQHPGPTGRPDRLRRESPDAAAPRAPGRPRRAHHRPPRSAAPPPPAGPDSSSRSTTRQAVPGSAPSDSIAATASRPASGPAPPGRVRTRPRATGRPARRTRRAAPVPPPSRRPGRTPAVRRARRSAAGRRPLRGADRPAGAARARRRRPRPTGTTTHHRPGTGPLRPRPPLRHRPAPRRHGAEPAKATSLDGAAAGRSRCCGSIRGRRRAPAATPRPPAPGRHQLTRWWSGSRAVAISTAADTHRRTIRADQSRPAQVSRPRPAAGCSPPAHAAAPAPDRHPCPTPRASPSNGSRAIT